ncbi:MBL fold metallo-hydrolase [Candidatus Saccharibacteria bacterium]|nr:MBL fold metallo-hydrolase [Candidatus Saccharibacteria bacterium]
MKNTTLRRFPLWTIKLSCALVSIITVIICGIQIVAAIQHDTISVLNTEGNITVNSNDIDGLTITPDLVFNTTNDAITYKLPLSSPDGNEFQIKSISDDNANSYIKTKYEFDTGMNANDKNVFITLKYVEPLKGELDLNNIHISIQINEKNSESGDESGNEGDNTGDNEGNDNEDECLDYDDGCGNNNNENDENDDENSTGSNTGSNTGGNESSNTGNNTSENDGSNTSNNTNGNDNNNTSNNQPTNGTTVSNNENVKTPNTGTNITKYLKRNQSAQPNNILPYVLLSIFAISVLLTILLPKKNRIKFGLVPISLLMLSLGYLTPQSTYANTETLELTIQTDHIKVLPDTEILTVDFPNIYNGSTISEADQSTGNGNAIILKTIDKKYVLIDAGIKKGSVQDTLLSKLTKENITIDYFIISHLDSDHYGNAVDLMNNTNIKFNNLIVKREIYDNEVSRDSIFKKLVQAAKNHNINVITSNDNSTKNLMENEIGITNYGTLSEGKTLTVGDYVKLYLYNTGNVYAGKQCKNGVKLEWTSSLNEGSYDFYKTSNGKYVYFDGNEYSYNYSSDSPSVTLKTTSTLTKKTSENNSTAGMNRYFYAFTRGQHNICQSNPNSIGVFAEVTTPVVKKYAYFPGDMENAGQSTLANSSNSSQLLSDPVTFNNNQFNTDITPYQILSETNVAQSIYNKLYQDASSNSISVNDLLNNISIYQLAHHGSNNNDKAMHILNFDQRSKDLYTIQESSVDLSSSDWFRSAKVYHRIFKNLPPENKLLVGNKAKKDEGITCEITTSGNTSCHYYYSSSTSGSATSSGSASSSP